MLDAFKSDPDWGQFYLIFFFDELFRSYYLLFSFSTYMPRINRAPLNTNTNTET